MQNERLERDRLEETFSLEGHDCPLGSYPEASRG